MPCPPLEFNYTSNQSIFSQHSAVLPKNTSTNVSNHGTSPNLLTNGQEKVSENTLPIKSKL